MAIHQFKSRRKTKNMLFSPAMIVILVVVIAFLIRTSWSMYEKYIVSKDRLAQAESQLSTLKDQESGLSQSIAKLSSASGTEAVMRTNFRIVKPGESLAVIVNTAATATVAVVPAPLSFWQKVGAWFADIF